MIHCLTHSTATHVNTRTDHPAPLRANCVPASALGSRYPRQSSSTGTVCNTSRPERKRQQEEAFLQLF